jgi:hypothetical protein
MSKLKLNLQGSDVQSLNREQLKKITGGVEGSDDTEVICEASCTSTPGSWYYPRAVSWTMCDIDIVTYCPEMTGQCCPC